MARTVCRFSPCLSLRPHSALCAPGALGSLVTHRLWAAPLRHISSGPTGALCLPEQCPPCAPREGHVCLDGGLSSCPADPASPESLHRAALPCLPACLPACPWEAPITCRDLSPLMSVGFGAWTLHHLVCPHTRPLPLPPSCTPPPLPPASPAWSSARPSHTAIHSTQV